jgi:hypothetical protein
MNTKKTTADQLTTGNTIISRHANGAIDGESTVESVSTPDRHGWVHIKYLDSYDFPIATPGNKRVEIYT